MRRMFGVFVAGGLLLATASSAEAQVGINIGTPYSGISIGAGGIGTYGYGVGGYPGSYGFGYPNTYGYGLGPSYGYGGVLGRPGTYGLSYSSTTYTGGYPGTSYYSSGYAGYAPGAGPMRYGYGSPSSPMSAYTYPAYGYRGWSYRSPYYGYGRRGPFGGVLRRRW